MSVRCESSLGRDLKKQRLLSPSKDACVVFEICKDRIRGAIPYEYHIYLVDCDPNSGGGGGDFTHIRPTFRLEWEYPLAFCGLDSTLYIFEGHDIGRRGEAGFAAKFEITPKILAQSPDFKLEDDKLVRLKRMRYRKYYPAALPTPDGKSIIVFSLRVEKSSVTTFELYDIARDSYQRLPQLTPRISCLDLESNDSSVDIMAYGFQTKCHFVVETIHREIYVLNLSKDIKKWKQYHRQLPKAGNCFIGINDEFFFTDNCVCDVAFARRTFPLPRSVLPPHEKDEYIEYLSRTTLLDDHDVGIYHTCAVQAEIYPAGTQNAFTCDNDRDKYTKGDEDICLVVADICSTNIQQYKSDVKKYKIDNKQGIDGDEGGKGPLLSTIGIKTLKFIVNIDSISFITMVLFSI